MTRPLLRHSPPKLRHLTPSLFPNDGVIVQIQIPVIIHSLILVIVLPQFLVIVLPQFFVIVLPQFFVIVLCLIFVIVLCLIFVIVLLLRIGPFQHRSMWRIELWQDGSIWSRKSRRCWGNSNQGPVDGTWKGSSFSLQRRSRKHQRWQIEDTQLNKQYLTKNNT